MRRSKVATRSSRNAAPTGRRSRGSTELAGQMTRPLRQLRPGAPEVLAALRDALSGSGPAIVVTDSAGAFPESVPQRVALVVETSGSTARPKRVAISADALLASAAASASAIGGDGQWLLAL